MPEEWKTAQQIKSFFSRYSTKVRQMKVSESRSEPSVFDLEDEDLEVFKAEISR